jgi:hypothetical protein
MSSKFQYRGNLAETPLPKMLSTIHRYLVPGVLNASHGSIQKRIYLDIGRVVFATSTELDDALGAFLLRRGMITQAQIDESGRRLQETGLRQGEVLVQMGLLTPSQMASAVVGQVANILWSIFDWEEGEVTFEVGRFRAEEKIQVDLPLARAIRDGLMKVADPKVLVRRIGPSWTLLEKVPEAVPVLPLEPEEATFLKMVDGKTSFGELCKKGPGDAVTNARHIYLFYCLDLVKRKADASAKKIQWRTRGDKASGS